jgi:hypothetical protein
MTAGFDLNDLTACLDLMVGEEECLIAGIEEDLHDVGSALAKPKFLISMKFQQHERPTLGKLVI